MTTALRPRRYALAIALFAIASGTRCSVSPGEPAGTPPLAGTTWRLVSLEPGAPLVSAAPPDRIPTLGFTRLIDPPRLYVGGNGPCNGFGGQYDAGTAGTIRIDSIMATRIGCEGDRGALESAYFDRLDAATTWSVRADSLILGTSDARWLLFVGR
jgi:heat shock protein HslJ